MLVLLFATHFVFTIFFVLAEYWLGACVGAYELLNVGLTLFQWKKTTVGVSQKDYILKSATMVMWLGLNCVVLIFMSVQVATHVLTVLTHP